MKKKTVVAGHICLDITPVFNQEQGKATGNILLPGKLVEVGDAKVSTGGVVANTGLAMKFFGVDVALMGKVGDDAFGHMTQKVLESYDVEGGIQVAQNESSSYSIVIAQPDVDRIFLHNPGTNNTFSSEDVAIENLKDVSLFHFGYPTLMKKMYEAGGQELIKLFKKVKGLPVITSLDLAAIDANSEAAKQDWITILKEVLPYVDIFAPSAEEICSMIDPTRYENWMCRAGNGDVAEILDIEEDIKPLAETLMAMGCKVLLIKCGKMGIYYKTAPISRFDAVDKAYYQNVEKWADREGLEESYIPDKVLSATGAGDTSIAAFLSASLEGYPLEKCIQYATATGAMNVTAYDALGGLLPLEALEERIQAGWKKQIR